MRKFVAKKIRLPKDFVPKAPDPGTTAYEYLSGNRSPENLMSDEDLWFIMDDKHPQGGLMYVFRDHSVIVYTPTAQ